MKNIKGQFANATIYTDKIEDLALEQIKNICDQKFTKESKIAIMPDVHAGKGCTIGTTMTISNCVVPNLVGLDIGCGMLCIQIGDKDTKINFKKLDETIKKYVPSGFSIRNKVGKLSADHRMKELKCYSNLKNVDRLELSIGTLGGGNHFIEINEGKNGNKYLVIHSGSRNLGHQVCSYYQNVAIDAEKRKIKEQKLETTKRILELPPFKRSQAFKEMKENIPQDLNENFACLYGEDFENYINDMKITQEYAELNRQQIAVEIIHRMGWKVMDKFSTIHNYIDTENMILRKGAVSAQKGERILIPLNMRDGSIIAIGKGNKKWNYSAPHGAGRLLSRSQAKQQLNLDEIVKEMENVWTSSVCEDTKDEAPMAYKDMKDILDNIEDTVEVLEIVKPIYNYKAK